MTNYNTQTGLEAANDNVEAAITDDVKARVAENSTTAEDTLTTLAKGVEYGDRTVDIAGMMVDPVEALNKFKEALAITRDKLQKMGISVDLTDIQFQQLEGFMVGESTESATLMDPALFRHPVLVMAMVLTHELLHQHNNIPNEALVQLIVEQLYGGKDGLQHDYARIVENFGEFVKRCKVPAINIYKMYAARKFESIMQIYEENYINILSSEAEKDAAYAFFEEDVFPELSYRSETDKIDVVDVDTDMIDIPAAA